MAVAQRRTSRRAGCHRAPILHRGKHRVPMLDSLPTQGRYSLVVGAAIVGAGAVALGSAATLPATTPTAMPSFAGPEVADEPAAGRHSAGGEHAQQVTGRGDRRSGRAHSPVTAQPAEKHWRVPLERFDLTSLFGVRWGLPHEGIDLAAAEGTPVYAAYPGTVIHSGWNGGFGKLVIIDHGNGIRSYYAHNSALAVSAGDTVEAGHHIANVGNTGNSFGPHSHFEIHRNGEPVDPLTFLSDHQVEVTSLADRVLTADGPPLH
jgi:murein DD-endopeptidase MepM/ murein hydrolase activator NlpD